MVIIDRFYEIIVYYIVYIFNGEIFAVIMSDHKPILVRGRVWKWDKGGIAATPVKWLNENEKNNHKVDFEFEKKYNKK